MADDFAKLTARIERLESALGRVPGGGVTDPPPDPWPWPQWPFPRPWPWPPRWPFPWPDPLPPGPIIDPPPFDVSQLTRPQLELALEQIKSQRVRLDAQEKAISAQLQKAK